MCEVQGLDRLPGTLLEGMDDTLWSQHTKELQERFQAQDEGAALGFNAFCAKFADGTLTTQAMGTYQANKGEPSPKKLKATPEFATMSEPKSKMQKVESPRATVQVISAKDAPINPVDGKPTIVYWDICGLGQCPRYALALAGVDFVDVRILPGDPGTPEYKKEWFSAKAGIGQAVPFPNLPYFLDADDADAKFSQSNAILLHIGRKYKLNGDAPKHLIDAVLDHGADFDSSVTRPCYAGTAKELVTEDGRLKELLAPWAEFLRDHGNVFMTGKTMTVADLKIYETLRKISIIEKEFGTEVLATAFPNLAEFMARVEALEPMKRYQASPEFLERPLNNPHAKFK